MVRSGSNTIRKTVYLGAVYGAIAWIIYGIVECFFSSILLWIVVEHKWDYVPLNWGFTALLSLLYPAIGLSLGGLSGLYLALVMKRADTQQRPQQTILSTLATLVLVWAFAINLIINHLTLVYESFDLAQIPPILSSILLTFALLMSISSIAWYSRLRFITNPWTVSILLISMSWIHEHLTYDYSTVIEASIISLSFVVILLVSYLFHRVRERYRPDNWTTTFSLPPAKSLLSIIVLMFLVFGFSSLLRQATTGTPALPNNAMLDLNKPNVLLITMDTVRADHLSLYDYERDTSPNLKVFSEEATIYTRAFASCDMTLSTHASIFTGMYAINHQAHRDPPKYPHGRPLADDFQTLADILSLKGYSTMAVVANTGYLSPGSRLNQGFQHYDSRAPVPFLKPAPAFYIRQGVRNFLKRFAKLYQHEMHFRRAEDINKEVFRLFYGARDDVRPFFLFINYMDAHWPYISPPPFDEVYPGKIEQFTLGHYRTVKDEVNKLKRKITEREYRHLISQYDGSILYLDTQLGKLFTKLKKLGLFENSLIIITSDHGEAFGERGFVGHGVSVYQDQLYVPLIVKYPETNEKAVVNEPVSVVDLAPTILDALDFRVPQNIDGHSLPKLTSEKQRVVIGESYPDVIHSRFYRTERTLYTGMLKFISSTTGKRELYDLSKDPNEANNLYKPENDVAQKHEARLNQWLNQADKEHAYPAQLDKQSIDRLRSLGYVK